MEEMSVGLYRIKLRYIPEDIFYDACSLWMRNLVPHNATM
jgi:hypothetical protein